MKRLWIAAAEPSGDALGAQLVTELRGRWPGLVCRGLAGPLLAAAGVETAARSSEMTAFGLAEVVVQAPKILGGIRHLARDAARFDPDVVVTIDSPGLMLRLARWARQPTLHWVAPQVWAWRPGRVARVAASVDTLCCLLPFEPEWFRDEPVRAVFTGHPAAELRPVDRGSGDVVALLPGSRVQEVQRLWPILRHTAAAIARQRPGTRFTVAVAPGIDRRLLGGLAVDYRDGVRPALEGAAAAVVCSGTATLEVAAAGVPQVVLYQVHPLTWAIGRRLVRGVQHVALPNVLTGRALIPEHLQHIVPESVARDVIAAMGTADPALARALESLRPAGSVARVADEVERLRSR